MENEIIKDYGKTVTPEVYIDALQGHQYIPQADQCIVNTIHKMYLSIRNTRKGDFFNFNVLDVGCGPGRLTPRLLRAGNDNFHVFGIDISETFINHAVRELSRNSGYIHYFCGDFVEISSDQKEEITRGHEEFHGKREVFPVDGCDVILMQGVMHHIHGDDRKVWLQRCFNLLKPDGILVVGDEFIRDYEDEEDRKIFVAEFYCHIIDEARKGGFDELAEEEAKNLIDDVFSGTEYAGHATQQTLNHIYVYAQKINEAFYKNGTLRSEAHQDAKDLPYAIMGSLSGVVLKEQKSFNRGDFKVSIPKFTDELLEYGFVLEERFDIGPMQHLGGMGVLVFMKR